MVSKDEWDKRRELVSPCRMHCTYSGMAKGTEAISNSVKIKPIALAIVMLCWYEGISQSSQSVENLYIFKKIPWQLYESVLSRSESLVYPTNTAPPSSRKNCGWFLLCGSPPHFHHMHPCYELVHDIHFGTSVKYVIL